MLQICAEAGVVKRAPQCVLMHGAGVFGPSRKMLRKLCELSLKFVDRFRILKEEGLCIMSIGFH